MSGEEGRLQPHISFKFLSDLRGYRPRPWWAFWRPHTSPNRECTFDVIRGAHGDFVIGLLVGTEVIYIKGEPFKAVMFGRTEASPEDIKNLRDFARNLLKLLDESETKPV